MQDAIKEVKLWVREQGAQDTRRLINSITSVSKFKTMPWFNRLRECTDEDLLRAAREQRDGWELNGPWSNAVFEIDAFDYYGNEVIIR